MPGARDDGTVAPTLAIGGPTTAAWREEALTRAAELDGLASWIATERADVPEIERRVAAIRRHIQEARNTAAGVHHTSRLRRLQATSGGSAVERTQGNLDAAETDLLRLAPSEYLCGLMPSLEASVNRNLPKDDPRRVRVQQLARAAETRELNERERSSVVAAVHASNSQRRREMLRVRSFRNVILSAATVLLLVAIGLGVLGSVRPELAPLCFNPDGAVVCPTHQVAAPAEAGGQARQQVDALMRDAASSWDVWLVELIGLVAAALAAALALRRIRGTSTPYSLPLALAALKLSAGAVTAYLGLLLMRGGFVPGLTALDTSAQILSWAIIFGYSQQVFTRFADDQAQTVLEGVGGRGAGGERELPRTHA